MTVGAQAQNPARPSKWKMQKATDNSFEILFERDRTHIGATECGEAYVEAPKCEGLTEGDCWIFHFPVEKLPAGGHLEFDFLLGSKPGSPRYFALEYLDGGEWKYKDTVKCLGVDNEPADIIQTIRFSHDVTGEALVRLRAVGGERCDGTPLDVESAADSHLKLMPYGCIGGYSEFPAGAPKDTVRVGYLGNSFTYVNAAEYILKHLAWYEGHFLDMNVNTYPGATFKYHISLDGSLDVLAEGGYDWFLLQDQSTQAARYGRDSTELIMEYTKSMSHLIRHFSPKVKILLEQTWAFKQDDYGSFGSYEYFDQCSTVGAGKLSKAISATVSPIAKAFAIVRDERPDIEIYSTDDHHPAAYGAYLKACVNYLIMFGQPFTSDKANFALDPATCAYLKNVAERTVL